MSKEKEIAMIFKEILDRTNELADVLEKKPIDIDFIRTQRKSYLEHYEENKALLELPVSEISSSAGFSLIYRGFGKDMSGMYTLVGLNYKNLDTTYGVDGKEEEFEGYVNQVLNFRTFLNKNFKKVIKKMEKASGM